MCESVPTIHHPREGTPELTDTVESYRAAVSALAASQAPVAVDVERAASFRYSDRAYLIQVRREDVGTYLFDPPALLAAGLASADGFADLRELNAALSNAVWILHSAHQDLKSLAQVGLVPPRLFDTEVAARLLGFARFSLVSVCEQTLRVSLAKDHQAADWSVRPLPHSWLRYAALDVELLADLYRFLGEQLRQVEREQWAIEEFECVLTRPPKPLDPQRWRSTPGAGKITTARGLATLEELWLVREQLARASDISPSRIVPHRLLVQLSLRPPANRRQLMRYEEMRRPNVRSHAREWLAALNRAKFRPVSELPALRRPASGDSPSRPTLWRHSHPEAFARLQCIRQAVKQVAADLDLDPEVVFEPRVQRQLAWTQVAYRGADFGAYLQRLGARPWQIRLCARSLEKALAQCPQC